MTLQKVTCAVFPKVVYSACCFVEPAIYQRVTLSDNTFAG